MDWGFREVAMDMLKRFGYLFYIMNPSEHVYEKVEDVKDYYKEVTPAVAVVALVEFLMGLWDKNGYSYDAICNVANGFIMELGKIPTRCAALWLYTWIYTNYRIVTLPWNSPYTWLLGFIGSDFMFYWYHRAAHQINIFWAVHETHHSPEHMSVTSSFRNHVFQLLPYWVIINPTAFVIPPTVYFVHYQMGVAFQACLHTERIGKLPAIIEYIFNTPSNHRVHHGRNRKYIDKNFSGVLILWDRVFGTYEEEDPNEKPVFGATTQIKSYNPLVIQSTHFRRIWTNLWEYEGIANKLFVLLKGPGWSPGKPWTGNIEDVPHPPPEFENIEPVFPRWFRIYIWVHFVILVNFYFQVTFAIQYMSEISTFFSALYIIYSCIVFGFILDKSRLAVPLEFFRCLMYFVTEIIIYPEGEKYFYLFQKSLNIYRLAFTLAVGLWIAIATDSTLRRVANGTVTRLWLRPQFHLRSFWSSLEQRHSSVLKSKYNTDEKKCH